MNIAVFISLDIKNNESYIMNSNYAQSFQERTCSRSIDFMEISYSLIYISEYICDGTTCANGGICIPINETEFQCDCPLGYSGPLCTGKCSDKYEAQYI